MATMSRPSAQEARLSEAARRILAGEWTNERGDHFTVEEGELRCQCIFAEKRRGKTGKRFNMQWDSHRLCVIMKDGDAMIFDPEGISLHKGKIFWYASNDVLKKRPLSRWKRMEQEDESPSSSSTTEETIKPPFSREDLLRYRHTIPEADKRLTKIQTLPSDRLRPEKTIQKTVTFEPKVTEQAHFEQFNEGLFFDAGYLDFEYVSSFEAFSGLDYSYQTQVDTVLSALLEEPAVPDPLAALLLGWSVIRPPSFETGFETSVVLKNIPASLSRDGLMNCLNQLGFQNAIDLLHMPTNSRTGNHTGTAFLNFKEPQTRKHFSKVFSGKRWEDLVPISRQKGRCDVTLAEYQGKAVYMKSFCHRLCIQELAGRPEQQPIILSDSGKVIPFPPLCAASPRNHLLCQMEQQSIWAGFGYEDNFLDMTMPSYGFADGWSNCSLSSSFDYQASEKHHSLPKKPKDQIKADLISSGVETRTNVLVRNISKSCTLERFSKFLDERGLKDRYKAIMPSSASSESKAQSMTVEFKHPKDVLRLLNSLETVDCRQLAASLTERAGLPGQRTRPLLLVSWSRTQTTDSPQGQAVSSQIRSVEKHDEGSSTEDSETTKATSSTVIKASAPELVPKSLSLADVSSTADQGKNLSVTNDKMQRIVCEALQTYFSEHNLRRGTCLQSQIDADGYVSLSNILTSQIADSCFSNDDIKAAIRSSKEFQLSQDELKVRRVAHSTASNGHGPFENIANRLGVHDSLTAVAALEQQQQELQQLKAHLEFQLSCRSLTGYKKSEESMFAGKKMSPADLKMLKDAQAKAKAAAAEHVAWQRAVRLRSSINPLA